MTRTWHNPERGPTPAELAAWADGELGPAEARRVEAWLADHPEAGDDAEAGRRLVRLFRDQAPPEPSPAAWHDTLQRIHAGLSGPSPSRAPGKPWRVVLGLLAAAALLGGVLLAGRYWPRAERPDQPDFAREDSRKLPPGDEDDEPFAVVTAGEVNIISVHAGDADRLVMDQPLMGSLDFAAPEDIEVVKVGPDPEEGRRARLQRGEQVPMLVLARPHDEEP